MLHLPAHHQAGGRADTPPPGDELGGRPLPVRTVCCGHVLGNRGEAAHLGAARMRGNALALQQHLQRGGGNAQLHRLPHMLMRHRVVVSLEGDVVVDVDARRLELCQHHGLGGQRPQGRRIQRLERGSSAAGQLLEGTLVQLDQQVGNGPVELGRVKKRRLRRRARIQRSTTCTPTSTLALSCGRPGRAGNTAR